MVIWILTVRSNRYHPNRRLLEAARLQRQDAFLVHPGRLFLGVNSRELIMGGQVRHRRPGLVLPRIGATIKEYGLTAIRHLQLMGIPLMNTFDALLLASNKFLSLQSLAAERIPVLETRYASNWQNFEDSLKSLGGFPIVIKLARSRQGSGVFLLGSLEEARPVLQDQLERGQGLLMQRYIPPDRRKDYRLFVVGEKVVGAMSIKPKRGEFRSNIHLGGKAEKIEPGDELSALAIRSAKVLGLDIAGVDVILDELGFCILEVNSSPGFKGLEKCTGKDIAGEIIRYAMEKGGI